MAIRKPTTTDDLRPEGPAANTAPEVEDPKYVKLSTPFGTKTTVPAELVDVLIDSGYSKTR